MNKGSKHTIEAKKKMSDAQKGKPKSKEHNRKVSEAHKKRFRENPEARLRYVGNRNPACQPGVGEKISKARKGHIVTEETRQKISKTLTGTKLTEEHKQNIKKGLKNSVIFFVNSRSKETRKKRSESLKKKWREDEEYRKKATITSCQNIFYINRPTSIEIQVEKILDEHHPNEWIYTGVGPRIVHGMSPDFVHISKKVVIEVNGDYWHTQKEAKERINKFKNVGYVCIIIWEHELKKENAKQIVLERVKNV